MNDKVFCYSLESVPIQSRTKRDRLKNQPDRAGIPCLLNIKTADRLIRSAVI